jgi:hypothetical protein
MRDAHGNTPDGLKASALGMSGVSRVELLVVVVVKLVVASLDETLAIRSCVLLA